MCERFTLTWEEWRQVAAALGVENEGEAAASYRPRFNIAPTDEHFIITSEFERRKARRARWGLVNRWAKNNSRASQCINAKAETLEQRTTFSEAFRQRRCIVPAAHDLLAMRPASPLVNSVKNEGPVLLEFSEAATPDLFGSTRG